MFYRTPHDIRVSIDVGCKSHQVAVGLSTGELISEFSISHQPEGFRTFFAKLEQLEQQYQCPVRVAMEGFNGYARPLDSMVLARGWQLYNINNLKLARFKEIFPGAAKADAIDARRGLELFQLNDHLPTAKKRDEGQVLHCNMPSVMPAVDKVHSWIRGLRQKTASGFSY